MSRFHVSRGSDMRPLGLGTWPLPVGVGAPIAFTHPFSSGIDWAEGRGLPTWKVVSSVARDMLHFLTTLWKKYVFSSLCLTRQMPLFTHFYSAQLHPGETGKCIKKIRLWTQVWRGECDSELCNESTKCAARLSWLPKWIRFESLHRTGKHFSSFPKWKLMR